jgi:tetratricopeptide (TPR) repeat protein
MPPEKTLPSHPATGPLTVKACAAAAAIFGVTLLAYEPALHGSVLWDDASHITAPALRSLAGLGKIWFRLGTTQQYYPVLHSAFWLEHRLWGDSVLGYHLANVLLHATAACLFAFALARLRPAAAETALPRTGDWLAAAIFALHPVCVESVAWISEQKNTLSLVFYLLSAIAYLRFDRGRKGGWYTLALGLFILALLSKSVTATLPAALLLILAWRRGRLAWREDVVPLLPWFAIGVSSGLFTAWVERAYIGARGQAYDLGALERLFLAGRVVWFYLGKLLWPTDLAFIYPRWTVAATAAWSAGVLGVAGALAVLWGLRRWSRGPLVAFLFFTGSLLPALGFFNVYPFLFSYVADHWQYLPCLGIIALAAEGATDAGRGMILPLRGVARKAARTALGAAAAGFLMLLFVLSRNQARLYRDVPTLYADTLKKNPSCWMAQGNLGVYLMDNGSLTDAIGHLREAIRIRPEYADAHNNLGNALSRIPGKSAEAMAEFEAALRLDPGMAEAHGNLGLALVRTPGRFDEGITEMETALRGNEDVLEFAALHRDLGAALAEVPARLPDALKEDAAALRLDPGMVSARMNLGIALSRAGRREDAAQQFEEILRVHPANADAHNNLANVLTLLGRNTEAIGHYRAALHLSPGSPEAHFNLGHALRDDGDGTEAIAEYREAIRHGADRAEVRNSLGYVLLREGRNAEALTEYAQAVRLQPGSAVFRNNLGIALTRNGRLNEAIATLRRAVEIDPGYAEAQYNLGLALQRAGRAEEAAAAFAASGRPQP